MEQLTKSLLKLLSASWEVVIQLLAVVVPWTPLVAWVAFWLLAVNWQKLYPILAKGGAIGVVLIGLMMILVWGLIAPPSDGVHHLLGLKATNFAGKAIYVTMLMSIMLLCGSVQLSGACGSLVSFPDEEPDGHDHSRSGHDDGHGGHAHHDTSHDH